MFKIIVILLSYTIKLICRAIYILLCIHLHISSHRSVPNQIPEDSRSAALVPGGEVTSVPDAHFPTTRGAATDSYPDARDVSDSHLQ